MKRYIRIGSVLAVVGALMTGSAAYASSEAVQIGADTSSVGVMRGDDVKFIDTANGNSYTTHIDGTVPFELNQAAPANLPNAGHVKVYIWDENPGAEG